MSTLDVILAAEGYLISSNFPLPAIFHQMLFPKTIFSESINEADSEIITTKTFFSSNLASFFF